MTSRRKENKSFKEQVNSIQSEYSTRLEGEERNLLNQAHNIITNRGYSHTKRTEKIYDLLNSTPEQISSDLRNSLSQMISTHFAYAENNKRIKSSQEVSTKVLNGLESLFSQHRTKKYTPELIPKGEEYHIPARELEPIISLSPLDPRLDVYSNELDETDEEVPQSIPISNYQPQPNISFRDRIKSSFRKAGFISKAALIALGIGGGAAIAGGIGYAIGNNSTEKELIPKIRQVQIENKKLKSELNATRGATEIATERLEQKLAEAGLPDEIVRKEVTQDVARDITNNLKAGQYVVKVTKDVCNGLDAYLTETGQKLGDLRFHIETKREEAKLMKDIDEFITRAQKENPEVKAWWFSQETSLPYGASPDHKVPKAELEAQKVIGQLHKPFKDKPISHQVEPQTQPQISDTLEHKVIVADVPMEITDMSQKEYHFGEDIEKYRRHALEQGSRNSIENLGKAGHHGKMAVYDFGEALTLSKTKDSRYGELTKNDGPGKIGNHIGNAFGGLLNLGGKALNIIYNPDPSLKDKHTIEKFFISTGRALDAGMDAGVKIANVPTVGHADNVVVPALSGVRESIETGKHLAEAGTNLPRTIVKIDNERVNKVYDWATLVPLEFGSNVAQGEGIQNMVDYDSAVNRKGRTGAIAEQAATLSLIGYGISEAVSSDGGSSSGGNGIDGGIDGGIGGGIDGGISGGIGGGIAP